MDIHVESGPNGTCAEGEARESAGAMGFAFPFFMAMLVAFVSILVFWPARLGNRLVFGENIYLGGLTVAVLLGMGMLLGAIVLCVTALLRR